MSFRSACQLAAWLSLLPALPAEDATFVRGINLNGPAVSIGGRTWDAERESAIRVENGQRFESQGIPLIPPAAGARARMIRSSVWGTDVSLELAGLPTGPLQVLVYVWEDNDSERFDILIDGRPVLRGHESGPGGTWRKLGPFPAEPADGKLRIGARGGAANLSGIEIWQGTGPIPAGGIPFVERPTDEQTAFFERRIRPVLAENCYECHRADAREIGGGLLLDSRAGVVKGSDSGPVVVPGEPDESRLVHAVEHTNGDLTMPPEGKLRPEEIADLREWIRMGAPDPRTEDTVAVMQARVVADLAKDRDWWAFRPLRDPEVPTVRDTAWPLNDLDRFVLARLERENLKPSDDADRAVLIRRATYDLTGLPPTPAETADFLDDGSPGAFERAVDRLLASPHYGERWGRHWLDVVRYADTAGDNSDFPVPQMHRYRDWVIDAFNRDLPYDEFVRHQLAGDLMPADDPAASRRRLIATGYIANARRFGSRVDDYPQHLTIEDTIDNLGRTFLGLTVGCARCHDHKFDPVSAADYYALYGIFNSTRYPWPGIELDQRQRDLVPLVPPEEVERLTAERDREMDRLKAEVSQRKRERDEAPADRKDEAKKAFQAAKDAVDRFEKRPPPWPLAYAVSEGASPADAAIQIKGDPARPGRVVPRRFLTVLSGESLPDGATGSGRRELADWIVDADNPLTARVMVNRIWAWHFGRGIVPTPNDFGRQGQPPTHPDLLDWLAVRFRESGWSIKAMHRMILGSRTWRAAGERSPEAAAADPDNRWLGAFPRRRLEAEEIRDTLLAVSGTLDTAPGGAHPFPPQETWKFTQHDPFRAIYETRKRSVYLMIPRIQRHPWLAVFDGADPSASTPERTASTTPLQALSLLNDPFVHEQAGAFAARLMAEADSDPDRIARAWRLAFARDPRPDECDDACRFLDSVRGELQRSGTPPESIESETWQALARAVFRTNEFVYLD